MGKKKSSPPPPSPAEYEQARNLQVARDILTEQWNVLGRPETARQAWTLGLLTGPAAGIAAFLANPQGPATTSNVTAQDLLGQLRGAQVAGGVPQQLPTWSTVGSKLWDVKAAGVPMRFTSEAQLLQYVDNPEWWSRYGSDFTKIIMADEALKKYAASQALLREKLGLQDYYNQLVGSGPQVNMPDLGQKAAVDPRAFGFGQTIDAPTFTYRDVDWASMPQLTPFKELQAPVFQQMQFDPSGRPVNTVDASKYTGVDLLDTLKYIEQFSAAPDWQAVGQRIQEAGDLAKAVNLEQIGRAEGTMLDAEAVRRGLTGSTFAGTSQAALDNYLRREGARMGLDVARIRSELEQRLRQEGNAITQLKYQMDLAARLAENERRMREGQFANQLAQQQLEDWWKTQQFQKELIDAANQQAIYGSEFAARERAARLAWDQMASQDWWRKTEWQRAEDIQRNQDAILRAQWAAQERANLQGQFAQLLAMLQGLSGSPVQPVQTAAAMTDIAQLYGQQAALEFERWKASRPDYSWLTGLGALGTGLGDLVSIWKKK